MRRLNGGPLKQDLQEVVTNLFGDASGTGLFLVSYAISSICVAETEVELLLF